MKQKIRYLGLLIGLVIFNINISFSQVFKFTPKYSTSISAQVAPELLKQCSRSVPEKIESYFNLESNDIKKLESDFKKVLSIKPQGCCYSGTIGSLKNHGFQYAGLVISNRKYIYINAFYVSSNEDLENFHKGWKTRPLIICDGGEQFWGVLYDIEKRTFSQLSMNGVS